MCMNMKCPSLQCLSSLTEGGISAEVSLEGILTSLLSPCFLMLNRYGVSHCQSALLPIIGPVLFASPAESWSLLVFFCNLCASMSLVLKCQRKLTYLVPFHMEQLKGIFRVS